MVELLSRLREACAKVAERARYVSIDRDAIGAYAAELAPGPGTRDVERSPEQDPAALWLTLDAINFGSGWFPTLRKRPSRTGYGTIEGGIRDRFDTNGPWSAEELAAIDHEQIAVVLGQDPDHELMGLFTDSLRDLGRHLLAEHNGSFTALADSAEGSAAELVSELAAWDCFADVSFYEELELPFLKRAQIAVADLHRAGVAFDDLDQLTMFADNLVPHVLRLDGILGFDADLVDRIDREELIEHGSPEEVEIRACAVHAVELIAALRPDLCPAQIDELLWRRGQGRRYKTSPRHRSRTTAY